MEDYHIFGRDYTMEIDAWSCHLSPNDLFVNQSDVGISGGAGGAVTNGGASSSTSGGTRSGTCENTGEAVGKGIKVVAKVLHETEVVEVLVQMATGWLLVDVTPTTKVVMVAWTEQLEQRLTHMASS
ncbi:hypothetical protein AXG93_2682s1010 [Marchantia polymorpha subsp. ruderalis]|uniref:Uncharacterized protein n=1 Tax=Marchantia polymorpha subsp. ruderalis TaxID=1480154 RepID=A0A176WPS4_MARPO|nr:hypothetical protein AXG93_2682s1010 [Marchantia polymorpha subsp. ruderalis]